MKHLLLLAIGLIFSAITANAQSNEELPCGSGFGYRPGGSTLEEASDSFKTELRILLNSCEVQELVKADNVNFYIQSYSHERGTDTLKYSKTIFKNGIAESEFNCVLTQTVTPAKKPSSLADMYVERKHSCTDASNPKNYVCKRGWIDCMPGAASVNDMKYCSQDYANWAKKNCGGAPMIAQ